MRDGCVMEMQCHCNICCNHLVQCFDELDLEAPDSCLQFVSLLLTSNIVMSGLAALDNSATTAGELEKAATPPPLPPPPPTPAADFSWGASRPAQSAHSLASLRDIQSQEAAASPWQGIHLTVW